MLASVKNDKVKIGDNLRIVREEKSLTQEKLAEKMDVDRQTVYRMEKGNYSMETFLVATLVLKVNLQDLLPKMELCKCMGYEVNQWWHTKVQRESYHSEV